MRKAWSTTRSISTSSARSIRARASGVVLYEVTNRGNKLIGRLNGVVPCESR